LRGQVQVKKKRVWPLGEQDGIFSSPEKSSLVHPKRMFIFGSRRSLKKAAKPGEYEFWR
jgi:hypothetical protein